MPMEPDELKAILEKHSKWLDSQGKDGEKAVLSWTDLTQAELIRANLSEADLIQAKLIGSNLMGANLSGANLGRANLSKADLFGASLREANLSGATLSKADLRGANFTEAKVTGIRFSRWGKYRGIRLDGCHGSPSFKRFAQDQEYIEEFRASDWPGWRFWRAGWRYWLFYLPWLIFADCGRSLTLWSAWSLVIATCFGFKYHSLGESAFLIAGKTTDGVMQSLGFSLETMIYYSVVTFTTLGFGDISPLTHEAARWVMAEVIIGYVMLGGLISIFANKLARRS